jgi:outer membrane protein
MNSPLCKMLGVLALVLAWLPAFAEDSRIITYDEAIRIALEQNSTLRQSVNSAALDKIDIQQARNQFLPNLSLSAQAGQSYGRNFSESEGTTVNTAAHSANFNAGSGVTLFDGFSNVASLRQARLAGQATELDVKRARETVVFTVASDFLALIQQREQLGVQRENLAAQTALQEQVQSYVDAGARTIADLYQQQANVAGARLSIVQAERAAELAKVDLIEALQLDPTGAYEFEPPAATTIAAAGERPALANLMEQALAKRADLTAEQARVEAAEQAVRVARGGRWPTVSLSAGYGTSYNSASNLDFSDQLDERRGGSIGLTVSIPIFDRGSVHADTRRAEIAADNARIAFEAERNDVGLQVRRAYLDYRSADEQLSAAEAQLRAAALSLEAVQDRYSAGAATFVELSQARATQLQAASAVVSARYATLFQRTLLDYYVGNLDARVSTGSGE